MYTPPFTITEKILHLIAEISEQVGSLNSRIGSDVPSPMLRKKNQEVKNAIEAYRLMLWQTMLLSKWKGIFTWIPVETIVKEHQQEYYGVIAKCDAAGESTLFIEFMLKCLLEAMESYSEPEEEESEELHDKLHDKFPELSEKAIGVLKVIRAHRSFNAAQIGEQIGISERQVKTYITKLKQIGLIVRVGSNKTGYWKATIEL